MRANPCIWAPRPPNWWVPTCDEGGIIATKADGSPDSFNHFRFGDDHNVKPTDVGFKHCPYCGGWIQVQEKLNG